MTVRRPGHTVLVAVLASALAGGLARPAAADPTDPVPVLSGKRILSPGPRGLGFAGLAADPSSIGNFRGVVGLAYLRGRVRDASGHRWVMENDIRVFRGDYVAVDGIQRTGAFAFV